MDIDRVLVKSQAKQIIKSHIFGLFLITFVVSVLCGAGTVVERVYDTQNENGGYSDLLDDFYGENSGSSSNNSGGSSSSGGFDRGYFDNFTGKLNLINLKIDTVYATSTTKVFNLVSFFMAPLTIALCGLYLALIRGEQMNTGDYFNYVFKNTFDKNYWQKLWCSVLQAIVITIMLFILIVPGVIFYYKYYFASTIIADNPNLKAKEAIELSKKITKNHRGELFRLDLSFLGWIILTILTLGILSIYTMPYYLTTKALYYENFRIRALQEDRVTALDFMNEQEKVEYYQTQNQQANNYYQPPQNDYNTYSNENNYDYYNNNNF